MAKSQIEWTEVTWNPVTGCDRVSTGCDHCLAPETRVLTADGAWVPISTIRAGDALLSFDDDPSLGQNRLLRHATVEAVWPTTAATITFTTASGRTVTCSENHRWLSSVRPAFRRADALTLSTRLRAIGDPSTAADLDDSDYQAGYVAGVTAGDGTMRWDPSWRSDKLGYPQMYWRVAVLETDSEILQRLVHYLRAVGVEASIRAFHHAGYGKNKPKSMAKVECRARADLAIIDTLLVERTAGAWKAGWLAGFLDTDGSCDGKSIRWSQKKPNDYLQRVEQYAADLGYIAKIEPHYGDRATTARLAVSNLHQRLSFLGTIRPALPRKSFRPYIGRRFDAVDDPVVAIRRGPVMDLVDIQTSTGTFIAEGLATHNCYALTLSKRLKAMGAAKYQVDGDPRTSGPGFGLTLHPQVLKEPHRWRGRQVVFVNSMSDLFHARVPIGFVREVFAVIADTPQHTYQILTKRSLRLRRVADKLDWPPNLWMGVSVENADALTRVNDLRQVPAKVRFLSCEPLLGPLTGLDLTGIHWVIAGGESGHRYRPMDLTWARDIRDTCLASGVPFFFKQWGGLTPKALGRELDGQQWDQMPEIA